MVDRRSLPAPFSWYGPPPYEHPITICSKPIEGEPINGDDVFVARCEYYPELMVTAGSPHKAYDGLMDLVTRIWWEKVERGEKVPGEE